MKKTVLLLGSTGSIGKQTIDVLEMHADRFSVLGLSCRNDVETLYAQANELHPKCVAGKNGSIGYIRPYLRYLQIRRTEVVAPL